MADSKAQVRLAYAILGGHARKAGMPPTVAKEIVADAKRKDYRTLPEKVTK